MSNSVDIVAKKIAYDGLVKKTMLLVQTNKILKKRLTKLINWYLIPINVLRHKTLIDQQK